MKIFWNKDGENGMAAGIDKMLGQVVSGKINPNDFKSDDAVSQLESEGKLGGQAAVQAEESEKEEDGQVQGKKESKDSSIEAKVEEGSEGQSQEDSDEEPSEVDLLKAQNAALKQQIESLASGELDKAPESKETPSETPQKPVEPVSFISDEDFESEEFLSNPKGLNKLGNDILSKGREEAVLSAVQMIHQLVPNYVHLALESERFFSKNPALAEARSYVSKIFQKVSNEDPKKSLKDRFEETRKRAYKALQVPEPKGRPSKPSKPRFPQTPTGGSRQPGEGGGEGGKEQKSEMQKGIDSMLNVVLR